MSVETTSRVRIEHECFIPVLKQKIRAKFLERLAEEGASEDVRRKFADFLRLFEAIYHFEYHELVETIKEDYALFEPGASPSERQALPREEIEAREDRFLENFLRVMRKGNFKPLTQADVDLAEAEEYLFTLPVVIDWDKLDASMLSRFFAKHPYGEEGEPAPEFANRILIFRRGVGVDSTEGRFVLEKTEMLLRTLLRKAWARAVAFVTRRATPDAAVARGSGALERPSGRIPGDKSHIHRTRYIERITLKNTLVGLGNLLRKTRIQEPTFERLVILYRPAAPTRRRSADLEPPRDLSIYIKTFRDIPMADLEVVFPEKKLSMNVVDQLKVGGTAMAGIAVVGLKFLGTAAAALSNPTILVPMIAGLFGYGGKTFMGYKRSKDRYHSLVTQSLYHKSMDNDRGVLFYLMDSLEAQEVKEAVLAYFFLWRYGEMTEDELDASAETFLKNAFDLEIDFEVDDALEKLVREGLVTEAGGKYRAADLDEALRILDHKWDNYFTYNAED